MKFMCYLCGKESERESKHINYSIKHDRKLFCSKECYSKYRGTSILTKCSTCGKEISVIKSTLSRSKSGNNFCSRKCATIKNNTLYKSRENHPNWVNGESSYRSIALSNLPNHCAICNYSNVDVLEVHHIDSNHENYDISNLMILCPTHHKEIHLGLV